MGLIHVSNWHGDTHGRSLGMLAPSTPADPLGAGNTQLLSDLAVTPTFFYDVRQNLTQTGGTVASLADVKGDGTYGPALGAQGTAPTWDGTAIKTNGTGYLLSVAGVADLSTQLTVALFADVPSGTGVFCAVLGAAAAGAPLWEIPVLNTGSVIRTTTSSGPNSTATSTGTGGSGNIRLMAFTLNVAGTCRTTVEVPTTAKVTSPSGATALASGLQLLSIGANTAGSGKAAVRLRAIMGFPGGYTVGQLGVLGTYGQTYHGLVEA